MELTDGVYLFKQDMSTKGLWMMTVINNKIHSYICLEDCFGKRPKGTFFYHSLDEGKKNLESYKGTFIPLLNTLYN